MARPENNVRNLVALVATLLVAGFIVAYPLFDYDFYWHLANGREMVSRSAIINEEVFSYTRNGIPFSNHEWLAQVVLFLIYDHFGSIGVNVFKALISMAVAAFSFLTCRVVGAKPTTSFLIASVAILIGIYRYNVRPELFSLLFVSMLLYLLTRFRTLHLSWRALVAVPILMLVWDWLHGAIFGLIILTGFISLEWAASLVSAKRPSWTWIQPLPTPQLRILYWLGAITLLVMIANPYGLRSYSIFFEFVGENSLVPEVNEFQPPTWSNYAPFYVGLVICIGIGVARWRSMDITRLLMLVPFTYLALQYSRATGVWALVAAPFVAGLVGSSSEKSGKIRLPPFGRAAVCFSTVVIFLVYVSYSKLYREDWNYRWGWSELSDFNPAGSVRFVIDNAIGGNLYNSGNVGGYLSFFITPQRRIFQYNHHTVFGNTVRFLRNPQELNPWNINYGIVSLPNELKVLFPRSEWARVFVEPSAAVVLRRTDANREFILRYEPRYFHPQLAREKLLAMARDPGARSRLITEMADYLRYREDGGVCAILGYLLSDPVSGEGAADVGNYVRTGPIKNRCLNLAPDGNLTRGK